MAPGFALRTEFDIIANNIIEGIHLEEIDVSVFSNFRYRLLSFEHWNAAELVDFDILDGPTKPSFSIKIDAPVVQQFELSGGDKVTISDQIWHSHDKERVVIEDRTYVTVDLNIWSNFEQTQRKALRLNQFFSFLVGARYAQPTFQAGFRNEEGELEYADVWSISGEQTDLKRSYQYNRFFTKQNTPIELEKLLENAYGLHDFTIYFMNAILRAESATKNIDDLYVELMGCLEQFHIKTKNKKKVILANRIDELKKLWKDAGFKGSPPTNELIKLRNSKPHGRGHEVTSKEYQKMYHYLKFLTALSRFLVLLELGFSSEDINSSFRRKPYLYGDFSFNPNVS